MKEFTSLAKLLADTVLQVIAALTSRRSPAERNHRSRAPSQLCDRRWSMTLAHRSCRRDGSLTQRRGRVRCSWSGKPASLCRFKVRKALDAGRFDQALLANGGGAQLLDRLRGSSADPMRR